MRDHYETLGVANSAEGAVIEAAYRALVKKYHPDIYQGDKDYANKRLQEINEAWRVLSDVARKKQYDKGRWESCSESHGDEKAAETATPEWDYILMYYPDLRSTTAALREISDALEAEFKSSLLLSKQFPNRTELANKLEEEYLRKKFGANRNVQGLARAALSQKQRGFAKELNLAIKRLGESEVEVILRRLAMKYPQFSKSNYRFYNFGHLLELTQDYSRQANVKSDDAFNSPEPPKDYLLHALSIFFIFLLILALAGLVEG